MKLKELTEEQAKQIVDLLYPFPDSIKGDMKFHYQPYDPTWYSDAAEYYYVSFNSAMFGGKKLYKIRVWIYPDLDCSIDYYDDSKEQIADKLCGRLPVRDQCRIQKLFAEWGLEPDYEINGFPALKSHKK
jgi:hypothetical protein